MIETDYQAELQRIEADIRAFETRPVAASGILTADDGGTVRLLYRQFQRAALTGEIAGLPCLAALVDEAIDTSAYSSTRATDLWLLKAHIALKRHRFAEAETALQADPCLERSLPAQLLQSDIDLQQGRYTAARTAIEAGIAEDPTWDAVARLAHLTGTMGDIAAADELYSNAEDELTAKQMQSFAWLEVQRGWMHFQRGDHPRALTHYQRANKAYSGYWLVDERLAELTGAKGRFAEAIAAYQHLYVATARPERAHALGELYSLAGEHVQAERWKRKAYAEYNKSATSETCYFHYLVDLCCELVGHAQEAVEWARKDVALRSNFTTQGDLAWALYRSGEVAEASTWIVPALASGAVSARLYTQAGCVYSAAGNRELGAKYMKLALATNPRPAKANIPARSAMAAW